MPKKAILFDRDGTLIIDKVYLNDPSQIEYLPGVFTGMKKLRDAGFAFSVVTNQSGVARGIVQLENLHAIHERLKTDFAAHGVFFDGFYYAPYSVESNHWMRKPNPGMALAAAEDHDYDCSRSWLVGDRLTDSEAGKRAGMKSLILAGLVDPDEGKYSPPTLSAANWDDLVEKILSYEYK